MTIQTCIPSRKSNNAEDNTSMAMRRYNQQQTQSYSRITKGGGGGVGNNNNLFITLLLVCIWTIQEAQAGWGSDGGEMDETYFGNTFTRSWLYESSKLSFQVEGCAWGYVEDSEEVGCLEDESEDGTTNWYMMANCRRPQVAFSVYDGGSCSSSNFVGSVSRDIHGNEEEHQPRMNLACPLFWLTTFCASLFPLLSKSL